MRETLWTLLYFAIALIVATTPLLGQERNEKTTEYTEVTIYDPQRDAEKDLADALAEATRSGKNVMLVVGGDWCEWCGILDTFYSQHPDLLNFRKSNYIQLKIVYGPRKPNKQVLSRFPKIASYPHILILDNTGKVLHSQETAELELDKSYDPEKFMTFLKSWVRTSIAE